MKLFKLLLAFVAGIAVAAGTVACADHTNGDFNAAQTQKIQTIVHDYLVQHPEVLVEASQALQQKQATQMRSQAITGILANKAALLNSANSPVAGNRAGTVTLVEFFDYQCPHCIDMGPVVDSLVKANPNLRVVYKEFPIFGDVSDYAARLSLAAYKQGKYMAFHKALFQSIKASEGARKSVTHTEIDNVAKKVGLNMVDAKKVMNSAAISGELKDTRTLAANLSLVGTPAFVVMYTDPNKDTDPNKMGFVPGQTDEASLQALIDKLKG